MSYRCPNADVLGPAQIFGYRLVFRQHADIEMEEDSVVDGVLWLIDDEDLYALDQFEGFPNYYLRQRVWVHYNNELKVAWVYQMENQDGLREPNNAYYELCKEGYKQNQLNCCQLEEAKIEAEQLHHRLLLGHS
jgi:gamma-glutamylcyclotransferase (GGCT)/AIG2-like uncharacterized protein YtfP